MNLRLRGPVAMSYQFSRSASSPETLCSCSAARLDRPSTPGRSRARGCQENQAYSPPECVSDEVTTIRCAFQQLPTPGPVDPRARLVLRAPAGDARGHGAGAVTCAENCGAACVVLQPARVNGATGTTAGTNRSTASARANPKSTKLLELVSKPPQRNKRGGEIEQ